jgi:hypothetical protein
MKYLANHKSKLQTVFAFEIVVSRSSKLDLILIGFEILLFRTSNINVIVLVVYLYVFVLLFSVYLCSFSLYSIIVLTRERYYTCVFVLVLTRVRDCASVPVFARVRDCNSVPVPDRVCDCTCSCARLYLLVCVTVPCRVRNCTYVHVLGCVRLYLLVCFFVLVLACV